MSETPLHVSYTYGTGEQQGVVYGTILGLSAAEEVEFEWMDNFDPRKHKSLEKPSFFIEVYQIYAENGNLITIPEEVVFTISDRKTKESLFVGGFLLDINTQTLSYSPAMFETRTVQVERVPHAD